MSSVGVLMKKNLTGFFLREKKSKCPKKKEKKKNSKCEEGREKKCKCRISGVQKKNEIERKVPGKIKVFWVLVAPLVGLHVD